MPGSRGEIDRRKFLKGAASVAVGGAAALPVVAAAAAAAQEAPAAGPQVLGPGAVPFTLKVDGKQHEVTLEPRVTLLDALRFHCGVTAPKEVCDRGACGSCAVLLEGMPVASCMMLAVEAAGRAITTTAGLSGPGGGPHPLHEAFVRNDALQCGFCTPGMVVSCAGLLARTPDPSPDDVREAVSGNICRCGTYPRVVKACREAAADLRKGK
jgi:aerobic-type carbon monoxide dehydrogenase small subunit (CoxS/CutS family)